MPKIRYIKNEFRFGITEFKTPCPFGKCDRFAKSVFEVASPMCKACKHFVSDDQFNEILTCNCMEGNVFDPEDLKRGVDALRKFKVVDPKRSHVKKAANFGGSSKKKKGGGRK